MNRIRVLTETSNGEKLDFDKLNKSMARLANEATQTITSQLKTLKKNEEVNFTVGEGVTHISLVTYRYLNDNAANTNDINHPTEFTINSAYSAVAGNLCNIASKQTAKSTINLGRDADNHKIKFAYTVTSYPITDNAVEGDVFTLEVATFDNTADDNDTTQLWDYNGLNQYSFVVIHYASYTPAYARIVGDLYQGNYDLLERYKSLLNKNFSTPLLLTEIGQTGDANLQINIDNRLLGSTNEYHTLLHYMTKYQKLLRYQNSNGFLQTEKSDKHFDTIYSTNSDFATVEVGDITNDYFLALSLPKTLNMKVENFEGYPSDRFSNNIGRLRIGSDSMLNNNILTSYHVNLINQTADLLGNNINANNYMSEIKASHLLGSALNISANFIKKYSHSDDFYSFVSSKQGTITKIKIPINIAGMDLVCYNK